MIRGHTSDFAQNHLVSDGSCELALKDLIADFEKRYGRVKPLRVS